MYDSLRGSSSAVRAGGLYPPGPWFESRLPYHHAVLESVVFVVLAAVWLVAWFVGRRWAMKAMVEHRLSIRAGAGLLGLLWAATPFFALIWQPQLLTVVLATSVLVFLAFAGVTVLLFRLARL